MYRSGFWRGAWLAAVLVAAVFLSACPDDDDGEEDEADEDVDVIALVVAALEEEPARLPKGMTVDEITYDLGWDAKTVAALDLYFNGEGGSTHHATVYFLRSVADARALLEELNEYADAEESSQSRGRFCFWDEVGLYIDADGVSNCIGRSDNIAMEVESGPVGEDEPEAALELLLSLDRYFKDLADDATRRVREVPPKPLAALLAAIPVPGPSEEAIEVARFASSEGLEKFGLVESFSWAPLAATDGSKAFFRVFEAPSGAETYLKDFLVSGKKATEVNCGIAAETTFRFCAQQIGEVAIVTQRLAQGTGAIAVDPYLEGWTKKLAAHLTGIRSGRLPEALKATPTPSGTRTPTVPPATPTATATALPAVTRFNAGTWTLDMVVKSNSCPGGLPAVGSAFQLQYEFTDVNDDGYVVANELFYIEQLLPTYQDIGSVSTPLKPSLSFVHLAQNGAFSGLATVVFSFLAEDLTIVDYVEEYAACRVTAVES